jgi:phage terminase small subunit
MTQALTLSATRDAVEMTGMDFSELTADDDSPMAKLTVKQRLWVVAFCALAGQHGAMTRAAEYAGYAEGTWPVRGSQNYRRKDIQAAIKYLAETKAHVSAYAAMQTLEDLNRTGTQPIRLAAAKALLGHAGIIIKTVHQHEITIDDNRDEDQIMEAVREQMKELGLDATEVIEATVNPEDDYRSHASGRRPDGMNQGRSPKKQLTPPSEKYMARRDGDYDFDDAEFTEDYSFDDC